MSESNPFHTIQLPAADAPLIAPSLRPMLTGGNARPKKHPTHAPKTRKKTTPKGKATKPRKRGR